MKSSIRSHFVCVLAALAAAIVAASAQSYPSRPITMIVGFPPGGPTDTLARIVADGMKDSLGQPIVIQN
ncbi:MAG TPA: tripartite tricarboxylate transporter substrate binding protein BugD, partial [Xanthobacteraceae bacterium]